VQKQQPVAGGGFGPGAKLEPAPARGRQHLQARTRLRRHLRAAIDDEDFAIGVQACQRCTQFRARIEHGQDDRQFHLRRKLGRIGIFQVCRSNSCSPSGAKMV